MSIRTLFIFVSNSDSVLKRDTEPIMRFRLGFVLKFGCILLISILGIGIISRIFLFFKWGLDVDEHGSICYNCELCF